MGIEIERKFLVHPDWRSGSYYFDNQQIILQGYLAPGIRVRTINSNKAFITVKGLGNGISRPEYEYEIPYQDALEMIEMCGSCTIHKIRHPILFFNQRWYVDEFLGDNYGLVVAEIELNNENDEFKRPEWLGNEVTFSNYDLAVLPWKYR